MKTRLLKFVLVCCLLFWGANKADAAIKLTINTVTTTTGNSGLASSPLNQTQTSIAVLGISAKSTGGASNITQLTFSGSSTIGTYFSNFKVYSSTNNSYTSGTDPIVAGTSLISGTTVTFTPTTAQSVAKNATIYYFLVADYTITNLPGTTFTFGITSLTNTTGTTSGTPTDGPAYTLSPSVMLGTTGTGGLATGTYTASTTNLVVLGFSVTTAQSEPFISFQFLASQTIGTYFSNLRLVNGNANSYSGSTTKTTIATITGAALNTSTLTISGLSPAQTFGPGTRYYYIVADYTVAGAASVSFQLNATTVSTSTNDYTNGGPITGSSLTLTSGSYDWKGGSGATATTKSDWNTAANWSPASVPGPYDIVNIGVNNSFTYNPAVNATASANAINFGNDNNTISLTVNNTLTVNSDITMQSNSNNATVALAGTGTINAVNINILANDESNDFLSFTTVTEAINSSVNTLNISGNVALTSDVYAGFIALTADEAAFNVTGGVTNLTGTTSTTGIFSSNNVILNLGFFGTYYSPAAYSVTNGTLNVYNPNFLSGLDNTGTNYINFNNTGSLVQYLGANQTIYTSSVANTNAGVSYMDIAINGSGTATTASGTLTVNNNLTTSSTTSFATKNTTVNISNLWTNTANVTQGSGNITVTNQLVNNGNTITGGSGALTAGAMQFNGGSLTASSGTVTCSGTYQNNGGAFNCGSGSVYFNSTYQNNAGTFKAGAGMVYFTTTTGQSLQDNTTAGTTFNNVTFSGISGTNTSISSSTGNFAVSPIGTLYMAANTKLTAGSGSAGGAGYLTLLSSSTSTASVAAIPSTSEIVGAVNVQRYITGGTGTRGYRLLSSPVNISTNYSGTGNLSLSYLNTNASFGGKTYYGAFTEGPGSGFTYNGSTNPIIYLYDETRATNNSGFTSGKNIGIYTINGNVVTTLTGTTQGSAFIPIGNSYLLYYVGNNTSTNVASTRVPDSTSITATGYLNQSNVPVKFWKLGTTNIPYDVTAGTSYPGLNQVGNPYASTISLDLVATDNPAVNKVFWELVPGGSYVAYSAATHNPVSDSRASKYIVSGQGFLVEAQGTGETLTFKESEKVAYPTGFASPFNTATGQALLLSIPSKPGLNTNDAAALNADAPLNAAVPQADAISQTTPAFGGLHMQLTKDSLNYVQTGIYFNNNNSSDKYVANEDATSVNGSALVYLSSYSSDNVNLGINQLGDYAKGKRVRLYAGVASSGQYNISLADVANIDTVDYNIFLVDNKMNDSLDMVHYKSYAFTINNSDTTTYGANRFVLAIERVALPPYKLVKFTGQKTNTGVELDWQTLNEGNYTGFILQKLFAGNYNSLYARQGNGGGNYSYVDKHPVTGNNTYRLQQTDINGNITYSAPITINYNSKAPNGSLTIYPNPSKAIITVSLFSNAPVNYSADIYNTSGTLIKHETVNSNSWTENISAYKLGVYIMEIKTNSGDLVGKSKFVKVN